MTDGPMSGKLPVEPDKPKLTEQEAITLLGNAARDAFLQMSDAMQVLAVHLAKISAIGGRLGESFKAQIEEISDGAGDDEQRDHGTAAG